MQYLEIAGMPTSLQADYLREHLANGSSGFHESCLRSYHIVNKVKWLLEKKTDPEVVLELIYLMQEER